MKRVLFDLGGETLLTFIGLQTESKLSEGFTDENFSVRSSLEYHRCATPRCNAEYRQLR